MNFRIINVYLLLSIFAYQFAYSTSKNTYKAAVLNFVNHHRTLFVSASIGLAGVGIIAWLYCRLYQAPFLDQRPMYKQQREELPFSERDFDILLKQLKNTPAAVDRYNVQKHVLGLSFLNICAIPKNFFTQLACILPDLEGIDLASNSIQVLPDSIGDVKSLQWLDLSNNQIQEIPDSISTLQNFNVLFLSNNPVKGDCYPIMQLRAQGVNVPLYQ